MSRSPRLISFPRIGGYGRALIVITVLATAAACGGSSSGGGSQKASPANTLAAALQLQQAGNLSQAKQLYEQVVVAEPSNVFAQYDLGVIAQSQGSTAEALGDYGAALTANPKYVPALYNEATIYAVTDPILAISTYRQVILLQPVAPTAELNLGLLEIKHGEPKQGVRDLARAVTEDSTLLVKIPRHLQRLVQGVIAAKTSPSPSTTPSGASSATSSP